MFEEASTLAAIARFTAFWHQMPPQRRPYVHPADMGFIKAGRPGAGQLHLDVVPIPVNGCLRTADVILLEANPNFDAAEESRWAGTDPEAARRLEEVRRRNLRQQHAKGDCPFYDLDPRLASSPGAAYWRSGKKFRDAATLLQHTWGVPLDNAFRELSWRIAVLQMFPYRSKKFHHEKQAEACPSGHEARLLAKALSRDPSKLVVCQRRVRQWGFTFPSHQPSLITYDPQREAYGASLSLNSRGGPTIIEKLASSGPKFINASV